MKKLKWGKSKYRKVHENVPGFFHLFIMKYFRLSKCLRFRWAASCNSNRKPSFSEPPPTFPFHYCPPFHLHLTSSPSSAFRHVRERWSTKSQHQKGSPSNPLVTFSPNLDDPIPGGWKCKKNLGLKIDLTASTQVNSCCFKKE